jgi:hypothetical protein
MQNRYEKLYTGVVTYDRCLIRDIFEEEENLQNNLYLFSVILYMMYDVYTGKF